MFFYGLLPIVNSGMLPWEVLKETRMPSATIAGVLFGPWLQYLIAIATIATILTCLNGFWLASARIMYSMGKARILPHYFGRLNKFDVPSTANWVILAVALFFIAVSGTNWLPSLFALMSFGLGIAYAISSAAFIKLRRGFPQWPRPFKLRGGITVGVVALIASIIIAYYSGEFLDSSMWRMFAIYCAFGGVIWGVLAYERRKHPEDYVISVPTPEEKEGV